MRSARVAGRATRWLQVAQDLGHLDDEALLRVVLAAASAARQSGVVTPDGAREAVAREMFRANGGEPSGIAAEDWAVLFS